MIKFYVCSLFSYLFRLGHLIIEETEKNFFLYKYMNVRFYWNHYYSLNLSLTTQTTVIIWGLSLTAHESLDYES